MLAPVFVVAEPGHVVLEGFTRDPPVRADPHGFEFTATQELEDLCSPDGQISRRLRRCQQERTNEGCDAAPSFSVRRSAHACSLHGEKEHPSHK